MAPVISVSYTHLDVYKRQVAIEPKTRADQEKLGLALSKLAEEDPTFKVKTDEETGQTLISGMGELHLEIIIDRLLREFKVEANVGRPQVAYRETIRKSGRGEGRYVRQTGGRGQYGHVVLEIEPCDDNFVFEDKIVGGAIPREYIPSVQAGVKESLDNGVIAGYPVMNIRVRLIDGSYHPVDSSDIAFKIAGSLALRDAIKKSQPILLEPVMKVQIITPKAVSYTHLDVYKRQGAIKTTPTRCAIPWIHSVMGPGTGSARLK